MYIESKDDITDDKRDELMKVNSEIKATLSKVRQDIFQHLRDNIDFVEEFGGEIDDISD